VSTKKSMLFLFAVILISMAFMTSLFIGGTIPTISNDTDESGQLDSESDILIPDDMKKDLKVAVSMDTEEYLKLVELSLKFEENHKDLKIEVEAVNKEEAYEYFKRTSQMGDAPDIMLLNNAWVNEFAALSYLAEVDEILTSNIQDLQVAPMISQVKWNGFLWAVPKEIDPYILVWNKNRLLEQEITQPPSSMEEFILLNHNSFNTEEDEMQQYGFYLDFNDPFAFISLLWSLGETWMESQEHRTALNNEGTIQKLEEFFYLPKDENTEAEIEDDIQENILSLVYPRVDEEFKPWELINEGRITMMITKLSDFIKYGSENVGISSLPMITAMDDSNELKGGWLQGKSFAVSSKTSMKKEAFEWIQNVTTTEAQLELMNAGGGLPVMISAYSERLSTISHFQEIVNAIEQGHVFPAQPELPDKIEILQSAMNDLWLEKLTISEFVEYMDESWNAFMDP
jgi:maltose-binding protein MalE